MHVDTNGRTGARGPGSDALLATKLHVPRVSPGYVARPRLIDQLDSVAPRNLVLVCAPAGFGKTALLAEWSRHHCPDVAWLSLDPGDNDPARFWRHLVAAIARLGPWAETLADQASAPETTSPEGLATILINRLEQVERDVALVLDDYHVIDDARVHRSISFLVEHQPAQLYLLIATRTDPPLGLARLRAGGRLGELRTGDLRFTDEEATALLRTTVDSVSDATSRALAERTEGWAAGLQLAALSLRDQPSMEDFVTGFSGSHRFVLDYLTEEVIERQSADVREFLLETSVLGQLTADLCEAVTGRTDGQAVLEELERANVFLVPLDDVRGWWRYHNLFADLLRARFAAERPARVVEVHRAAAAWHDVHDMADAALHHALAAGDPDWAARIVERHADARLHAGEAATLRRWLGALPADVVRRRPRLLLAEADLALISGDTEAFERPFLAAERALARAPDADSEEPYEPVGGESGSLLANVPAAMALGRAHLAELSGDAATTEAFAARASELLEDDQWMLGILVQAHKAVSALLAGAVDEAASAFEDTFDRCRAAGERVVASRACRLGGLAHRAAGRLDAAYALYRAGVDWQSRAGSPPAPAAGQALLGIVGVEYQRNRLAHAEVALDEALRLCRQLARAISGSQQPLANALAASAWLQHARGDAAGAQAAMAEAMSVAPGTEVTSLLNPVPALAVRLQLAQGDTDAAIRWTEERGLTVDAPPSFACEPEQLLLGRVLMAQGRLEDAARYLDRLATAAGSRRGSLIEIEALRAVALTSCGRDEAAAAAVRRAFDLGWDDGWRRVFIDEGDRMAGVLQRITTTRPVHGSDRSRERALALLEAYAAQRDEVSQRSTSSARAAGQLIEPLSERELEVLRLVAAGRPNREIAEDLFVAVDTVKKHVTHILGKLEVANRTQAAARARELDLLDDDPDAIGPGSFPPHDATSG